MNHKKQSVMLLIGSSILFAACQVNSSPRTGITQPATTGTAQPAATGAAQPETKETTQPATIPSTQPAETARNSKTEYPVDKTLGVVNANLTGEALFARQGEWIFQAKESSEDGIIKSKLDGSEQSVVVHKSAKWLNLVGDWLYFVDNSSNGSIAKVKTDGTEYEIIYDSMVTDMILRDDWIYFIDITKGRQIHKIKTDGTELTKLDGMRATRLFLEGDWLYFSEVTDNHLISENIYRVKIDGPPSGFFSENLIRSMTVGEGNLYFINNRTISMRIPGESLTDDVVLRRKLDNSELPWNRTIRAEDITLIGVYQGWVYYYTGEHDTVLTRQSINTGFAEREILLSAGIYGRVQFLGDKIIFYDYFPPQMGYRIMDLDGSNLQYFR